MAHEWSPAPRLDALDPGLEDLLGCGRTLVYPGVVGEIDVGDGELANRTRSVASVGERSSQILHAAFGVAEVVTGDPPDREAASRRRQSELLGQGDAPLYPRQLFLQLALNHVVAGTGVVRIGQLL